MCTYVRDYVYMCICAQNKLREQNQIYFVRNRCRSLSREHFQALKDSLVSREERTYKTRTRTHIHTRVCRRKENISGFVI